MNQDENYVVYINWDGFAWYYYELANSGVETKTPVINELADKGVLFKNAYTGIPSITNPMQIAILTGSWPQTTGNCYKYFDKEKRAVTTLGRHNDAETIAEAAVRQGLKVASIHHYILINRGTEEGNPDKPYISLGENISSILRFDEAIKLIKGEPVGIGKGRVKLNHIPRFIAMYMDDLDGFGHNGGITYGILPAVTEKGRLDNVIKRLELMDKKLGEFLQACKNRGIYDRMTFVLTTDHGMSPFGKQGLMSEGLSESKLPDLVYTLEMAGYKVQLLQEDEKLNQDTDIVLLTSGLSIQLYFTQRYSDSDVTKIISAIKGKNYMGKIMKKEELINRGAMKEFADLYISPKVPYCFRPEKHVHTARGNHDSLEEHSQHIFSLMWGRGVKQGYVYTDRMYNIDFARTMTTLLGIEGPSNATGSILSEALILDRS